VALSGVDFATNEAIAKVTSNSDSYAKNANITASALTIANTGHIYADAIVGPAPSANISGIRALVSRATSSVTARQKAYIEGGSIKTSGKTTVKSTLTDGSAQTTMKQAGIGVAVGSADLNYGIATYNAGNAAFVKNANFGTALAASGALDIIANSASVALAEHDGSVLNASAIKAGVLQMTANANGSFDAYIDSTYGRVYVGALTIKNNYSNTSNAKAEQPRSGVGAALAEFSINKAIANTSAVAKAYISGSGIVSAASIAIESISSNTKATARVEQPEVNLSGSTVGTNVVTATV
jgi:hypothetical protein